MDLESECCSLDHHESTAPEALGELGEIETVVTSNGVDRAGVELEGSGGKSPECPTVKGWGLRKWRRLDREGGNEESSSLDSDKKRALVDLRGQMKQWSDGPVFAAVEKEDSGNSEDRSSRSSTAASGRRVMPELLQVAGDGSIMRDMSGQDLGIKGRTRTGKKARGVKVEKDNSQSSFESDSCSSKSVFVQGTVSNGGQSGRAAANYNEEEQTAFGRNNNESEDLPQEGIGAEKRDLHTLAESIMALHSAQEAFQREVQKLKDVGKEDPFFSDHPVEPPESSNQEPRPSSSNTLGTQMVYAKQNPLHLQSRVFELEPTSNHGDTKTELDQLVKRRIEAEVEYVVIRKTIQNLTTGPMGQIKLRVQLKKLASEHKRVMGKLEDAENKAMELKRRAEMLETACQEIVEKEEECKLQSRVCRYASCFMIQLMLFLLVLWLFVLEFNMDIIPT